MAARQAAVAGRFYPEGREELWQELEEFFSGLKLKQNSRLIISPHAGYTYSGRLAALAFSRLAKAESYVLLGPNHTGFGSPVSITEAKQWETPLGRLQVDRELAEKIVEEINAEFDESAHLQEHSLEVQLPFLQFLQEKIGGTAKNAKIVPITLAEQSQGELETLGKLIGNLEKKTSVIISSDFTHYEPAEQAREKDLKAIAFLEKMDSTGFYEYVLNNKISVCGAGAIVAGIGFGKEIGLKKGELLNYANSGDVTGEEESVVGYAAIAFQ